ncbi:MAG: dockerin type I domain-containing protein [Planctomycetota bacterium]
MRRRDRRAKRIRSLEALEKRNLLFAPIDQATMLGGIETLAETLDQVETHAEYAESIPGLEAPVGQLADFSEAIRGGLIEPLSGLLNSTSDIELSDVTSLLDGYSQSFDGSVIEVLAGSVNAAQFNGPNGASIEVTATIQQTRTLEEQFDGLEDFGWIGWAELPTVEATAESKLTITVGVDLVSEQFFARLGELSSNLSVDTVDLDAALNVGPVAATVTDGAINVQAELVADFGNTILTANDLQGTSLDTLISVEASGSLNAELPTSFEIGDYSASETIAWQDPLAFDRIMEAPTFSETGDLIAAVRIDQDDLLGFFSQIGTKLDELLAGNLPNFSNDFVPWVDGLQLPDLSGVSDKIQDFINDELIDDETRPSFQTFDDLRQRIQDWTGRDTLLSYLPDTSELTYAFEIPADVDTHLISMRVDEDFDAIGGIDVTGTVDATGEFVLSGVFGVDLTELAEDTTPGDLSDDDSWADHFFVDDLELAASIDVASDSASASANFGFVGIAIGDVGVSARAAASIRFADDQTTDGRISFKRLSEAVVSDPNSLVERSSLAGDAEVSLREMSAAGIPGLEMAGGEITITFADLSDADSFSVDVNEPLRNINALSSVTLDQWVDLAGDVIDLMDDLTSASRWDRELPGIGQSVNDLIGHASKLQQAVDALLEIDEATIQDLGERFEWLLEDALRLNPDSLDVSLHWQDDALRMLVQYNGEVSESVPLSLDMGELIAASSDDSSAFDLLGDLVDVGGSTQISVAGVFDSTLSFGIDVADILDGSSATPEFFVDDTSGVNAELDIAASEIDASIALGPLGLFVVDGTLMIDADGEANTTEPTRFSAHLTDVANGRYSIDHVQSLDIDDVETVFEAGASIVLPLYFPTVDDPVGGSTVDNANAIVVGISNVAGIFNQEDPGVTLRAPEVNSLVGDFDPLDDGLRVLAEGLDALLQRIEDLLREKVLNQNLPMVGERLESAADFLKDVREDALPILRDQLQPQQLVDEVKLVLHNALGSVMRLSDINDDAVIDYRDVDLAVDSSTQEAILNLSLGDSYVVDTGIGFDLGLPGMSLELEGDVAAALDWAIDVGIGINPVDGFYVDITDVNEIELDVEVTIPDAALTGTLGLFQVQVTDRGSMLEGQFDVDLKEPSGDGKLTMAELISGESSLDQLVDASLTGGANVDLGIIAGTTFVALPELHGDFVLEWSFDGSNLAGSVDRLAIENIELDLGTFVSGFAGDILRRVQSVLEPIQPIVDILTTPLPVANDLEFLVDTFADATAPYDAVNLLDLASLLGNVDVEMLDAIVQIIDIANSIPTPVAGESVMIPLGEVIIVDGATDPNTVSTDDAVIDDTDLADELSNFSGSDQQEQFAQESASFINKMTSVTGGGFQFPILDHPASLIGVMLGQDATLFAYQTPKLSADFAMGVTIPITGPLAIELVGGIGVDAQFAFGYDTLGLRNFIESKDAVDLADGFFISDRENADGSGADVAEVNLRGSLEAFASLTAGVASASIGGGIYATVGANLNDNDADGKVRLGEFVGNLPRCAFDFAGSLSAGLRMKAQVFGVPFSQNIATVRLLEFSTSCHPAQDLALGEIDDDGVYTLFVGDKADQREVGQGIIDEFVTFSPVLDASGNEAIEVSGFGVTETIRGVSKIVAHAGDGNDSMIVVGSIHTPVEFHGGQGDDELVGGAASDTLRGGDGDDLIQGGDGDDVIFGGVGVNTMEGGEGNDAITGGDSDDFIDGGDGDDIIDAKSGHDTVLGGAGMDLVDAGFGDDVVFGGPNVDIINGGAGDDSLDGGLGDDSLDGQLGDDTLHGRDGNDSLDGGEGSDTLHGNSGNDIVTGGYQSDQLFGGEGDDLLIGGNQIPIDGPDNSDDHLVGNNGDDILIGDDGAVIDFDGTNFIIDVIGGHGNDTLDGGDGNDWGHGVGGNDQISGGVGNDHLIGGDDADEIFGDEGSDWLEGGDGSDRVFGHAGGDLIGGGLGDDYLDGGDDEDQIFSHETGGHEPWYISHVDTEDDAAGDVIFGRSGPDEIVGGAGDDFIDGGSGRDAILGRGGDDTIEGGLGNDEIDATEGNDLVLGQWGDDKVYISNPTFDRIDGQHGGKPVAASLISNTATNQLIISDQGVNLSMVGTGLAQSLSEIDRIDALYANGFETHLDTATIRQITDEQNTLRLDLADDATATLDGEWTEQAGENFDGLKYRRLTSHGVTLIVRDLQPMHRKENPHDVNGDGDLTPIDALLVINAIRRSRRMFQSSLPAVTITSNGENPLADVNGDNQISPLDALLVINQIRRRTLRGEPELPNDSRPLDERKESGSSIEPIPERPATLVD